MVNLNRIQAKFKKALFLCGFLFGLFGFADGQTQDIAEDSLLRIAESSELTLEQMEAYYELASLHQHTNPRKARSYFLKSLKFAKDLDDSTSMVNIYYGLGISSDYLSEYEEARENLKISLSLAQRLKDDSASINIYNSLGVVALRNGSYESALQFYQEALKLSELMQPNRTRVKVIGNMGHVFYYQNQLGKAMEYYNEALNLSRELKNEDSIAECLQHIGLVKHDTGDVQGATDYFQEALRIFAKNGTNYNLERANLYQNMGVMFKGAGDFQQSRAYYDSSLSIYETMGNMEGQAQSFVNVGELMIATGKYAEAESYFQKAMKLSIEIGSLEGKKYSSASLADLYESKGELGKALEFQRLFKAYSDSLLSEQSSNRISELEAQFSTERKEQEIAILRAEQEVLDAEVIAKGAEKRQWIFGMSMAVLGLISIIAVLFFRQKNLRLTKQKERQKEFSEKLIRWQEQERKRIAGELHDGLGQSLVMLKNKVLKMQGHGLNGTGSEQLESLAGNITNTIQEVRSISYALRPYQLEILGLQRAIEEMVEESTQHIDLEIQSYIDPVTAEFSKEDEVNVFRIIQECLTNLVKHSQSNKASIHMALGDNYLNIRITDNGVGFDPSASLSSDQGFGLKGVKERVRLLGGTFRIESAVNEGCRVMIKIPRKGKLNELEKADSYSG